MVNSNVIFANDKTVNFKPKNQKSCNINIYNSQHLHDFTVDIQHQVCTLYILKGMHGAEAFTISF